MSVTCLIPIQDEITLHGISLKLKMLYINLSTANHDVTLTVEIVRNHKLQTDTCKIKTQKTKISRYPETFFFFFSQGSGLNN